MAIKPIDLQTNFIRTETIGKEIADQKEALMHNQARQAEKAVLQSQIHTNAVTKSEDLPDGTEKTKADSQEKKRQEQDKKKKKEGQDESEPEREIITDPTLGKHIDITG
jgi:hypothetical protein